MNKLSIPAWLVLVYGAWIALGTALLKLPIAAHQPVSWIDAFFTAVSAVTVTGLIVVDTSSAWTLFGQGVIMALIQFGGLGLITFAVFVLAAIGARIDVSKQRYLAEELNVDTMGGLIPFVKRILGIFIVCELLGMALIATQFVPEYGWGMGLWHSLFHSISAFNNAGFSTFSDSLMGWVGNPVIIWTISLQFILSGLGFLVLSELFRIRRWRRLSLHTRLMLIGTPLLIIVGVGGYAALEWTNPATLGSLDGTFARLQASWFEGVTPRTAGFNAMDTAGVTDATALLTMVLMFIGGGATSTAGGIKVTTAFVLLLATIAFFRRSGVIHVQRNEIGPSAGLKVMALLFVGLMLIFTALFVLILTQELDFLDAAFEVFSAFGTVGLSRGATGALDTLGKLTICVVMFLGRLGPLTLGFMLATKTPPRLHYPEGKVYLG
ncbi:TrkH family potassium uptake protein [Algimonas porphyrae]|uniref:Ktr system potassium transporter B n=1 Tax=Algimonas porphyrae TaxID=1128113 RepID=A0ABQ5UZZ7_9PROT|nr:TrkH family potassium uptake protein [Algimonas porphyrae]GLQ20761.1 Ktr system potassium transporter B [Algimonas porphyrae]